MTSSDQDLLQEIESAILSNATALKTQWLIQLVVANHADGIRGPDSEWAIRRCYEAVASAVRDVVRRLKPSPTNPELSESLLLPGFDGVQIRYSITRDGEQCIVPIEQATDEELLTKAMELDRMAAGCAKHAAGLRRYVEGRERAITAAE